MKRSISLVLGMVVCLIIIGGKATAKPRLVIDEAEFNFGYVPKQAKVSHVFWLKSAGDDVLKIVKVKPRCGCTKAPLDKSEIAPGDSARLEIIFNTRGYKTRVVKSARIETNEGEQPKDVRFESYVVDNDSATYPIVIQPGILSFKPGDEHDGNELHFNITNVSEQPLELKVIDWPKELVEIRLPEKIEPGATVTGGLSLNQKTALEGFEKSFTIETNDTEKSRFTVPFKRIEQLSRN